MMNSKQNKCICYAVFFTRFPYKVPMVVNWSVQRQQLAFESVLNVFWKRQREKEKNV